MISVTKREIMFVSVVLASVFVFVFCLSAISSVSTEAASSGYTVIIDAGHGGRDGGVSGVATGVKESDLNLAVARELKTVFESNGVRVVLTRSSEEGLYGIVECNYKRADMKKRKEIIQSNRHDAVISVHMNYYPLSSRRGAQVFYNSAEKRDDLLANCIQSSLNSMENAARNSSVLYGDYYILKCSDMPSVIVECGFLSNSEDEKLLIDKAYRKKLCSAIYCGTAAYLMI